MKSPLTIILFCFQIVLFLGVTILLASTYVTLYPDEKTSTSSVVKIAQPHDHIDAPPEVNAKDGLLGDDKSAQDIGAHGKLSWPPVNMVNCQGDFLYGRSSWILEFSNLTRDTWAHCHEYTEVNHFIFTLKHIILGQLQNSFKKN